MVLTPQEDPPKIPPKTKWAARGGYFGVTCCDLPPRKQSPELLGGTGC
jgi:hypothetical protein